MHVQELQRLGANIQVKGNTAVIRGVHAAQRRADHGDRPSRVSLPGAGGPGWPGCHTVVDRVYHIDRGYEKIEEKLSALGARIRRNNSSSA